MGIDLSLIFGPDILSNLDTQSKYEHDFITKYKGIWADNGDALSLFYAGTGSILSNKTRTGKGSIFGFLDSGLKSISRFYVSNFEDQMKQECINILLARHFDTMKSNFCEKM